MVLLNKEADRTLFCDVNKLEIITRLHTNTLHCKNSKKNSATLSVFFPVKSSLFQAPVNNLKNLRVSLEHFKMFRNLKLLLMQN